jgi:hypothetical protein
MDEFQPDWPGQTKEQWNAIEMASLAFTVPAFIVGNDGTAFMAISES